MFERKNSISSSTSTCSTLRSCVTNNTLESNLEQLARDVLGDNHSVLGVAKAKAIYQAVSVNGNIGWKILGGEVVIALSWEHKNSSTPSKRTGLHCIDASTGRIVLEEYVTDESMYEVFSKTFHACRIDQSNTNNIIGIQFASSMDAEYLEQAFNNVMALELHRKILVDEHVLQSQLDSRSEASVTQHSVGHFSKLQENEIHEKILDSETNYSRKSFRHRRPLSSVSLSGSMEDKSQARQMDIVKNRSNITNLRESYSDSLPLPNRRQGLSSTLSQQSSRRFLPYGSCSERDVPSDRSFRDDQRTSLRSQSLLPTDISKCTVSAKCSLSDIPRVTISQHKCDVSLLQVMHNANPDNSRENSNSSRESQYSRVIECNQCVHKNNDSCIHHTSSSSSGKSSTAVQIPEKVLASQVVYENLLAELNQMAIEKIQEFIQSMLREGPSSRSTTEKFCKSQNV